MSSLKDRVTRLLEFLEASQIPLVEWETSLWIRLGYPLVWDGSLFLLVPDHQLQHVRDLAIDTGLSPADEDILPSVYPCETSRQAVRFLIDDCASIEGPPQRRLVFLPMSWTGITLQEIVSPSAEDGSQKYPPLPSSIQTVPLPVVCAALVRIAIREKRSSRLRTNVIETLSKVISNSLFDMSHDDEQSLFYREILGMENAASKMRRWTFRRNEWWIKEMLILIMTGHKTYDDLPSLEYYSTWQSS